MPDGDRPHRPPRPDWKAPQRLFETRSQAGKEVGLRGQLNPRPVKRARREALVLVPLFIAVVVLYDHRLDLFGTRGPSEHGKRGRLHIETALETPIRVAAVLVLLALGWAIARDFGSGLGPALFRRLDPAT